MSSSHKRPALGLSVYCWRWAPEPVHSSLRSTWQPRSRSAACASSRHDWCWVIARRRCDSTLRLVKASTRSGRLATMLRTAMHADFCNTHTRLVATHNSQQNEYAETMYSCSTFGQQYECSEMQHGFINSAARFSSALEVHFNVMRSINSRFTYLLTYLLITICTLTTQCYKKYTVSQ